MMAFLQNILQRHQLGPASQPTSNPGLPESYIVQPRPQSRFESDQGTFTQAHEGRSDEPHHAETAGKEPGLSPAAPLPLSPTAPPVATIDGELRSSDERNESIEGPMNPVTPSFDQPPFEHQLAEQPPLQQKTKGDRAPAAAIVSSAVAGHKFQQVSPSTEPRRAVSQESAPQQNSQPQTELSNELNQRIETVLQAFNNLQTHTDSHPFPLEPRQPITVTSAAQNHSETDDFSQPAQAISHSSDLQSSNNQPMHADEQQTSIAYTGNRVLPTTEVQPDLGLLAQSPSSEPAFAAAEPPRQSEPKGSLQIPDWLADIQAELHNHWREINQQVESEPVVNVTIGRVEVRAVQDKPAKQAKARNRPSGVMTLDAYLKQRDRRGQA
jgi:hypothetical protein